MAVKAKPSSKKTTANKNKSVPANPAPVWLWLLTGLLVGLFVALLLYMQTRVAPSTQASLVSPSEKVESRAENEDGADDSFTFDFYKLLPNMEVDIPQDHVLPDGKVPIPLTSTEKKGTYVLQVGSFKNFRDADKLKATLAFQGLVSRIVEVNVKANTWHRVYVGPYTNISELNEARHKLHQNKIDSLVVKLKG